ncbi:hypothetical protein CMI37_25760 [Candidatus Pacearchaeota archaeon]|nr:hypothetical protein [Candidatus Pacearchaeota archaeon]
MSKHSERSKQRMANYQQARQVTELEAAELNNRANGSWNVRSMWDGISGIGPDGQWIGATPRVVGKSMRMWYYNGRTHAHPAFTGRTRRVGAAPKMTDKTCLYCEAPMNK